MKRNKLKFTSIFMILSVIFNLFTYIPAYASTGFISGTIWYDANGNGKWELGNKHEYRIPGVKVELFNANDMINPVKSATTSPTGQYYFSELMTSNYKIKIRLPNGYEFTNLGSGNGNGVNPRLTKIDPKVGITEIIQPTKTDVNIGLIKGVGTIDTTENVIQGDLLDINRNLNIESAKKGDTFDAKYTITPKPILVQKNTTEKDIVLVIDTSTSMDYILSLNRKPYFQNEKSRLQIIKSVASNFVNKFKGDSKVNIALVDYNKTAKVNTNLLNVGNYSNANTITSAISNLRTDSNTNIGDGLRVAYYLLNEDNGHEKYIVLMTDGYANTYSINNDKSYYMSSGTNVKYDCKSNTDPKGLEYAKKVASEKIASLEIKSFIVGFGSEANYNNKQIAEAADGVYQQAVSETAVSNVYDQIQKKIQSTVYGTGLIEETFNGNLEVANLPSGFSVNSNTLVGNFPIEYTLNGSKTQYEARPITVTVKYRVKENVISILGSGGNSSFGKVTVLNNTQIKYLPEKTVQPINQNGDYLDVHRSISDDSVRVGESFTANYTMTPKAMPVVKDNTQKNIVLVIDTSRSMTWVTNANREPYLGEKSRLSIVKNVATNFIDKFKSSNNIKIGIVEYFDYGVKVSDILPAASNIDTLNNKIDSLRAGGGTNIGDGIRTAKAMLDKDTSTKDKYIILMTDGVPTAYSRDKNGIFKNKMYQDDYLGSTINTNYINYSEKYDGYNFSDYIAYQGNQNGTDVHSLDYAKYVVSNMLKDDDKIKSFTMIGFGSGADGNNAEIVDVAGGYYDSNNSFIKKGKYYSANDTQTLQSLYDGFANSILSKIHGTIDFQETFNENLEVQNPSSLPYGLKVEGNKVIGKVDIEYNLNAAKTEFVASPINFSISYKAKDYGDGILGGTTNSSFAKMSVSGYEETKYFDKRIIELKDSTPPTTPSITANTAWSKEPVQVTITPGNDSESGVNRTEYKLTGLAEQDWTTYSEPFHVNSEGETTISARTIDNQENISQLSKKIVKIDMTPPTSPSITWDAANHKVTIVPGTDLLSGVEKTQYSIVENGSTSTEWTPYNAQFTVSNTNNVVIKARTVDNAENISDVSEKELDSNKPEVNIKIRDASGIRDEYNITNEDTFLRVNKLLDPEIKLQGEAYVDINLKSEGTDDLLQYKIIKYNGEPSSLNVNDITGWSNLDLQQQNGVNNDVVTDKQGYLNWRGYDVNHMPTLTDTTNWSDPEQVFKYPYAATAYKAANTSSNSTQYGQWESIVPYTVKNLNNQTITVNQRWITNSIFLQNMNIGGNYKEASKFWGYIKVPSDGNYSFGAYSDDGCRGYITIDGVSNSFVDMFKPQGSTWGTTNKVFNLKADKYYPIYLEYFNWGGWADFRLQYSNNSSTRIDIPSSWFYPSKNLTPGEYGTTLFAGSAGVKIPTEAGRYYVVYRTGEKDSSGNIQNVSREGIYGSFVVEQKAELTLIRELNSTDLIVGNEVEIKATITPQPFSVYSVFQEGSANIPETYTSTVSNFSYEDVLPSGLIPLKKNDSTVVNGQKININLQDNITYTRVGDNYVANPIVFSVYARIDENKEYLLSGEDATLTYKDIDDAQRQLHFDDLSFGADGDRSSILKQGIFLRNNSSSSYIKSKEDLNKDITVVQGFPITLAMLVEVNNSQSSIKINIDDHYKTGNIVFKKYELKANEEINNAVPEDSVTINSVKNTNMILTNTDSFKLSKGKKYLIVYTIVAQGQKDQVININSYINNLGEANLLKLIIEKMPKLQ